MEEDQIALFVAATVVSDWVPDQVILDVGTKALGREGSPELGYGGIAGKKAVLARLNEYHGFGAVPAGESSERRHGSAGGAQPRMPSREQLRGADRDRHRRHDAAAVASRRPWTLK